MHQTEISYFLISIKSNIRIVTSRDTVFEVVKNNW